MADKFEEEAEPTISIHEYLKDVEDQELEADLVLGGDEGKECTYSKGYMKRQAIFSCLTCTPEGNAGICTACSLSCHDGHEILELWTKRNFKCDCGNSKFGEFFCTLFPNKDVENTKNSYSHNFKGAYCTCGRPYPDPDVEEQEEMIQCCICEDWFHEQHLGLDSSEEIPRDEEGEPTYEDMICQTCSAVCDFLYLYPKTIWATSTKDDSAAKSKEKGIAEVTDSSKLGNNTHLVNQPINNEDIKLEGVSSIQQLSQAECSQKELGLTKCSQDPGSSINCLLGLNVGEETPEFMKNKAMFLGKSWRNALCRCDRCLIVYNQKCIGFLVDKDDSIAEYEKVAKEKREEKLQQQEGGELNFLNNLGHVEKIEILTGIADMKNEITSFFESYDPSKPITSDDIHQVFENLAKKRRRDL
ncbi:hypothetical protein V2J09_004949 [Rumex salicifolius]